MQKGRDGRSLSFFFPLLREYFFAAARAREYFAVEREERKFCRAGAEGKGEGAREISFAFFFSLCSSALFYYYERLNGELWNFLIRSGRPAPPCAVSSAELFVLSRGWGGTDGGVRELLGLGAERVV